MKKTKRLLGIFLATTMFAALVSPLSVFAWDDGGNGDALTREKKVEGRDAGTIEVDGTIGAIDNTDPKAPITEGNDAWINVGIPKDMVFAAAEKKANNIISPKFTVVNYSGRGVKVSINSFAVRSGETEVTGIAGSEIKVILDRVGSKINNTSSNAVLHNSSTLKETEVVLRSAEDAFLTNPKLIAILQSKYKKGDTDTEVEPGKITLQFRGRIVDAAFPATGNAVAKYTLTLGFAAMSIEDADTWDVNAPVIP